jgi:hypothetical protein
MVTFIIMPLIQFCSCTATIEMQAKGTVVHYLVKCRRKCSFAFAFARIAKTKRYCSALVGAPVQQCRRKCSFALAFARIATTKRYCSALPDTVQAQVQFCFCFCMSRTTVLLSMHRVLLYPMDSARITTVA